MCYSNLDLDLAEAEDEHAVLATTEDTVAAHQGERGLEPGDADDIGSHMVWFHVPVVFIKTKEK